MATSAQQAQAITQQSINSLTGATAAIRAMRQAQNAAHNLVLSAPSAVPNGLVSGGLQIAPGVGTNPLLWQNANLPTQSNNNGWTLVTVKQTAQKAILTWSNFNIGKTTQLYFDQSAGTALDGSNTWVVLNRILDPSGVPSQILGSIKAEGSVYVLNPNGIIFGGSSQVNVHSLIASSLDLFSTDIAISNADFLMHGIDDTQWMSQVVTGSSGQSLTPNAVILTTNNLNAGSIFIQQGASIAAGDQGLVLVAAPNVTNAGVISAPDGQAVLIAGIGVLNGGVSATSANALAFYNYGTLTNAAGQDVTPKGTLINTGLIEVLRGNITLRAADVVQDGVVAASTSVSRPGNILIAADYEDTDDGFDLPDFLTTALPGTVTFGPQSVTTILPDANGATVPSKSAATVGLGSIQTTGLTIDYQPGSLTYAPGQTISDTIVYYALPLNPAFPESLPAGAGRILVESGARIDTSGIPNVELPIASTLLTVTLAGNELADSPLQRNGFLYGGTITVDSTIIGTRSDGLSWVGTPLADLSGYAGLIPQSIDQVLTNGGTVSFQGAEVDLASGALINLTGGYVHYLGGIVKTTRLVDASGHLVDISLADPNEIFVGIAGEFSVSHPRWGITETYTGPLVAGGYTESDYIVGGNAGTLTIDIVRSTGFDALVTQEYPVPGAGALILNATIDAAALSGTRQIENGTPPQSGHLSITTDFSVEIVNPAALTPSSPVHAALSLPDGFSLGSPLLASLPGGSAPNPYQLPGTVPTGNPYANFTVLSSGSLDDARFSSISITSTAGSIRVDDGVTLAVVPGGSIALSGIYAVIGGNITARAGSISVTATGTFANSAGPPLAYLASSQSGDAPGGIIFPEYFSNIIVGSGATLDASGLFVNDSNPSDQSGPAYLNGGAVSLLSYGAIGNAPINGMPRGLPTYDATGSIILSQGSVLDVSGGGRVLPGGKLAMSDFLPVGSGGNVTLETYAGTGAPSTILSATYPSGGPQFPTQGALVLNGTIDGLGFNGGGTLTLGALAFQIGGNPDAARPSYAFYFDPAVWGAKGFGKFDLTAGYDAVIPDGTVVTLKHSNLIPDYTTIFEAPTGADPAAYATIGVLSPWLRTPTNLSVTAGLEHYWESNINDNGDFPGSAVYQGLSQGETSGFGLSGAIPLDMLLIGHAKIDGDPGAGITLVSDGWLSIYGTIRAPGGAISVTDGHDYDSNLLLGPVAEYLAPGAVLDVSGTTVLSPLATPILTAAGYVTPRIGTVLNGGMIALNDDVSPILVAAGATLDVAGAADTFDVVATPIRDQGIATLVPQAAWSNGGQVTINGTVALLFDGTLRGAPGAPQGTGATLTITQDSDPAVLVFGATPSLLLMQNAAAAGIGPSFLPVAYHPGLALPGSETTTAAMLFGVDSLQGSGFGTLSLNAQYLAYSGPVSLVLPNAFIVVQANTVEALPKGSLSFAASVPATGNTGALTVRATYISFGAPSSAAQVLDPFNLPQASDGTLTLEADQLDLTSFFTLQDIGNASFVSTGDLRFLPAVANYTDSAATLAMNAGELLTSGNLTFKAARIYAATDTIFLIEAANPGAPTAITFGYPTGVAVDRAAPLSANATLLFDATTINQNGNLHLPFGSIILGLGETTGGGAVSFSTALGEDVSGVFQTPAGVVTQSVTLGAGSLTSVSGAGALIPYGSTIDGNQWVYNPLLNTPQASSVAGIWSSPLTAPPAKLITLTATSVAIGAGATVDISGGGDLQASEWVPGTGGSRDLLSQYNVSYATGVSTPTAVPLYPDQRAVYAILPGYNGKVAPYDPAIDQGLSSSAAGIGSAAGPAVYLSGVPGLPAGIYTLLPGKYATLPGAFRVVINSGVTNPGPAVTEADGTILAPGYFVNALTGQSTSTIDQFIVQPASVWGQYSQYTLTIANSFFPGYAASQNYVVPFLPMDAGHLILGETATQSLILNGTMLTAPATVLSAAGLKSGAGAEIDVVAQYLEIVDNVQPGEPTTTVIDGDTYTLVSAAGLDALDAGSLVIGGVRSRTSKGITITPLANGLVVANDSSVPLTAPEILLTAQPVLVPTKVVLDQAGDSVTVLTPQPGTGTIVLAGDGVVTATGSPSLATALPVQFGGSLSDLPVLPTSTYVSVIQNDWSSGGPLQAYYQQVTGTLGSLVQVSTGAPIQVTMPTPSLLSPGSITSKDDIGGTGSYTAALPSITGGGGVTVEPGATLASANTLMLMSTGDTRVNPGAQLRGQVVQFEGIQITFAGSNAGTLPTIGAVFDTGALTTLEAANTLRFESASAIEFLGNVSIALQQGTLALSGGSFESGGGTAAIGAPLVILSNDLGAPSSNGASSSGSLVIQGKEIELGGGDTTFTGFGAVTLAASNGIVGVGIGSFDFGGAALVLKTPVLASGAGSTQTLRTTGSLAITWSPGTPLDTAADVGGAINLIGASVSVSAPIKALSGIVTIEATQGDLDLNAGASISVASVAQQFYDVREYTPAGAITLTADTGSVRVAPGVLLDLSSTAAGGGNAGSLTVAAERGSFDFDGTLASSAARGNRGGSFSLDVTGFAVNGAGSLDVLAALLAKAGVTDSISVHTRTGDLTLTQSLTATVVSLTADGGLVDVSGTINASGLAGGEIDLYGTSGVTLSGRLIATGSDPGQRGGTVDIGTIGTWDGTLNADGSEHLSASGTIELTSSAVIDVSGGSFAGLAGGTVNLRAIIGGTVNVVISPGAIITGARSVVLEAYKTWNTRPGSGFDGIIDPQGWFTSSGTLVAGSFTDANGNLLATWNGTTLTNDDGTTNDLPLFPGSRNRCAGCPDAAELCILPIPGRSRPRQPVAGKPDAGELGRFLVLPRRRRR